MGECCYNIKGGSTWKRSALIRVDRFAANSVIIEAEYHNAFEDFRDGLEQNNNSEGGGFGVCPFGQFREEYPIVCFKCSWVVSSC
jgi:hypothetical protein